MTSRRDNQRWARRGTTTQRGLGSAHQRRRRELLPAAIGTHCPIAGPKCDGIMTNPSRMDLDHSNPRALGGQEGDRITCSPCNRGAGARLGNQMRRARRSSVELPVW